MQGDKLKKEERERKLKGLSAEEQRKFLEREAEQERKKVCALSTDISLQDSGGMCADVRVCDVGNEEADDEGLAGLSTLGW